MKNFNKKDILEFTGYFFVIVTLSFFLMIFVGERIIVDGNSMYNTLENGQNLIMDKLTYRFHDIERFDVVVFYSDGCNENYLIKRVIGLPNESIKIDDDGVIWIKKAGKDSYEVLSENYGYEPIEYTGIANAEVVLGKDEYFVLGDNRNNSIDSRYVEVGNVKRNCILGRAWLRITPFSKFGFVDNIKKK